jgi:hypothetical protein
MFAKSTICARPGWSQSIVDELLGEPDETAKAFTCARNTYLYAPHRVYEIEASDRFKKVMRPFKTVDYAICQSHIQTGSPFEDCLRSMTIAVAIFNMDRVKRGAIGHHSASTGERIAFHGHADGVLEEVIVNYARDVLCGVDEDILDIFCAANSISSLRAVRYTKYRAVADAYPALAEKCGEKILFEFLYD